MVINGRFLTQPVTGVQRYAVEMTRAIRRLRPAVKVLSPPEVLHRDLATEFEAVPVGRHSGYTWEQLELPSYLKRSLRSPLLLNLANLAPIRYTRSVVVIHDVCPLRHPQWYGLRFRWAYRILIPRIARRALRVITDSRFSADEIQAVLGLDAARIGIVPCAAAEVFRAQGTSDRRPLQAAYILTVGSLDRRKNVRGLLEAFRLLAMPDLRLVIIGRPNRVFAEMALPAAGEDGQVVLETAVDDRGLSSWYRHALLFVFPSLYEGFGLPPLEAMECGCPCLISSQGALSETFGDAACYCDPLDIPDMAAQMRRLLLDESLRTKYRERGRERSKQFTWSRSADALLSEVDSLE